MSGDQARTGLGISRRSLLRGAGVLAAGALAGGLVQRRSAKAAGERWKMRLSGSSINYTALSIEKACERLAGLGFDAIDVWSAHANCPHLDDVLQRLKAEGLKELLA